MGSFNFGAFAGGLAEGIERGIKLDEMQKNRELKEKELADKKAKEQQDAIIAGEKRQAEEQEKIKKEQIRLQGLTAEVDEIMYDTDLPLDVRIKKYNSQSKTNGLEGRKTIITNQDGIDVVVPYKADMEESIQTVKADIEEWKGNGLYKIDKTGTVYSRPNEVTEFQPVEGLRGDSRSEFGKKDADKTTESSLNISQYEQAVKDGFKGSYLSWKALEKPDKGTTVNINSTTEAGKTMGDISREGRELISKWGDEEARKKAEDLEFTMSEKWNTKQQAKVSSFQDAVEFENRLVSFQGDFDKLATKHEGGITKAISRNIMDYVGKGNPIEDIINMSDTEFRELTGIETESKSIVVDYVKMISGAAVTDAERQTLTDIIFGSKYQTSKARKARLDSFVSGLKRKNKSTANAIKGYAFYTSGSYLNSDNKSSEPKYEYRVVNGKKQRRKVN